MRPHPARRQLCIYNETHELFPAELCICWTEPLWHSEVCSSVEMWLLSLGGCQEFLQQIPLGSHEKTVPVARFLGVKEGKSIVVLRCEYKVFCPSVRLLSANSYICTHEELRPCRSVEIRGVKFGNKVVVDKIWSIRLEMMFVVFPSAGAGH